MERKLRKDEKLLFGQVVRQDKWKNPEKKFIETLEQWVEAEV